MLLQQWPRRASTDAAVGRWSLLVTELLLIWIGLGHVLPPCAPLA
ncbi:MAG TPA: hypothetical protein VNZ94_03330 [Xanthobacteraceae bacterium]|nr:hypothetical protein [Xanthobacteraceae bacterium]